MSEVGRDHYAMMALEAPEIVMLRQKMVKARKPHACCWCKKPIEIGQLHESSFYIEDGKPMAARVCGLCYYLDANA